MPALADKKKHSRSKKEMDLDEKAIILDNPLRLVYAGYLSIKTKDGRLIKLDLNSTQQKLFSKILELRKAGKPIRAWVLKYRQGGISTEVEAIIYALTSQQENINSLILADEKEHANNLFEMSKLYQERLEIDDPHLAPRLKKSNEKKLEFEGIHSQIIIASAENKESAKSHTFHAVHLCLHPESKVIVNDGRIKPLNQVVSGDKVVTHLGHIAKVRQVTFNKSKDVQGSERLLSITVSGGRCFPIQCTSKHPIFVRDSKTGFTRKDGRGQWKPAESIKKGDMLGIPLRIAHPKKERHFNFCGNRINADFDIGYVFGVYLAEGSIIYNRSKLDKSKKLASAVALSMGDGEKPILDKIAKIINVYTKSYSFKPKLTSKTIVGIYYGSKFASFILKELGAKDNKHIPNKYWSYPKQFIRGLIKGYLDGDAHIPDDENVICVSSVRPQILIQLRDLLLGYRIGYSSLDYRKGGVVYNRNCRDIWILRIHGHTSRMLRSLLGYKQPKRENDHTIRRDWRFGRKHCWVRVENISEIESETVGDIVLDHPDHSFRLLNGVAVHNSEVAFFPDLKTVLADLNQTVPDLPGTMVIGETTANGMNEFYHQWVRAVEGKTDWLPLFFPWFEMSEYSMPLQDGKLYPLEGINFTADTSRATFEKEEQDLKFDHNLTDEQLNWRRYAIVNKCQGSLYTFKCQYPSTWQEAFETSGSMFFDQKGMAKQKSKLPIAVGELFYTNLKWEFRDLPQGRIEIFERPGESEQYIVAGDASEAVDSDEAAILVLNKRTNTTAAIVVGQHPPEELAQLEISLGNYYNNAIIAQENKGYGYQVNQLVFANYGNVYRKIINKDGVDVQTDELGFNTNSVTRPQMLAQMAEEIKHNSTSLLSAKLIAECNSFVIKRDSNGNVTKIEAQDGVQDGKKLYQDGLVICRAIAGIVRNQFPYKILETKDTHARQRAAVQEHKRGMFGYE